MFVEVDEGPSQVKSKLSGVELLVVVVVVSGREMDATGA